MISNQTKVRFYISQSKTPSIVSPKTDIHWFNNKNITFVWKYNGEDIQFEYEIRIIKTNINKRSEINEVLELFNSNPSLYSTYTYSKYGNEQSLTLDLSSEIEEDGIYIWQIRTRGTLSREWSEWASDGLVRVDENIPYIKNICAITKSPVGNLASSISDFSFPYLYTKRTYSESVVKDRHIDRSGQPGLYITYDYRDNSINLRAQTGSGVSPKRYYGMISFHKDSTSLSEAFEFGNSIVYDQKYSIQNLVKSVYQYSINKKQNNLGPFDSISADQILENNKLIFPSLNKIIHNENIIDLELGKFVPKGFPTFFNSSVYENQGFSNHPIGFESSENFVTPYPIYTRRFKKRTYRFPKKGGGYESEITLNSVSGQEYVEARYPAPYQDFFLIFRQTGVGSSTLDLIGYGQYSKSDVILLMSEDRENPSSEITNHVFEPIFGFSVIQNRSLRTVPDGDNNIFFDTKNSSLYTRSNLGVIDHQEYFSNPINEESVYSVTPYSFQIFFNLNATFDKDQAVKIYLREETLQPVEFMKNNKNLGFDPSYQVAFPYVEFNFRPDTDCTSVFITEENLSSPISLDEIFIGRAKVSPRDLSMYDSDPSEKTIYKDIKIQYTPNDSDTTSILNGWGRDEQYFNNDPLKYNGSIRLQLPNFEFVPYYSYATAYNNSNSTDIVPNIYDANPNPNNDETINWDSIVVKSAKSNESEKSIFLLKEMLYGSDFARFNNTSKFLSQIHPFLYNVAPWNIVEGSSIYGKGKILKFRNYIGNGQINDISSINNNSYSMYESGIDLENNYSVNYNQIDRGLFGFVEIEDGEEENTSKIYIKDFSNHIFRKSIRVDIEDSISSTEKIISSIYPSNHSSHERTFVWGGTNVETDNVQISGEPNGPTWIFNKVEDGSKSNFVLALISSDASPQGQYKNASWARSSSIGFSGLYFLYENSSSQELIVEQIERSVLGYDSLEKESLFSRSKIQNNNFPETYTDVDLNANAYISGDVFEIGNIFGYVYPENSNVLKFFFDIEENTSGIDSIKYLEVDIPVELSTGDLISEISSINYFGIESNGKPTPVPIKIQKMNSKSLNYNIDTLNISDDIFSEIRTSRSPIDVIEYYMNNSPSVNYVSLNREDSLDIRSDTTDYGFNRFSYNIAASGSGFKIFFFRIKDKAGNESNIYASPVYLQGSSVVTLSKDIVGASVSADDSLMINENSENIFDKENIFLENLLPVDTKNNRSIIVKDIITEDENGNLVNYPYVNDLLIGFSDSYGLNYNVYSPLSSISTWNFKRPIYLRVKGFNAGVKGPDWFFDPNDIRHYIPDSSEDYSLGVGQNNNILNVHPFHIPSNPGTTPRTLIGFLDENIEKYARSNAMVRKIYENKEEFIGKYLTVGSLKDISFKILDIFKSEKLSPANRFDSSGQPTNNYYAEGDGGASFGENPREKIWIVIEDPEALAALVLSRKFQYITEDSGNIYTVSRGFTGWRDNIKEEFSEENYIENFGYFPEESEIPLPINSLVNESLKITKNITSNPEDLTSNDNLIPMAFEGTGDYYIYIDPSSFDDTSSGISSNEAWTTRIYQGYSDESSGATPQAVFDSLKHHQLLGINYYNKMIFGDSYNIDLKILKVSYNSSTDETFILLNDSWIDYTLRNSFYKIYNSDGEEVELGNFQQEVKNISLDGDVVSLYGKNVYDALNVDSEGFPDQDYSLRITIEGLDYIDENTGEPYDRGWWPKIDGLLVPPIDQKLGSSISLWDNSKIKFVIVSTGSFFIPKEGEYFFKIEKDQFSYSDFSIDFFGSNLSKYVTEDGEYKLKNTSISMSANTGELNTNKSVYLVKGWHTARFRYRADNSIFDTNYKNYLRLLYSKPGWVDSSENRFYAPLVGTMNQDMNFMSRAYRSVFGRIIDKDFNRYPKEEWEISSDDNFNYEANALKATVGFRQSPVADEILSSYNFQALKLLRNTSNDSLPEIFSTNPAESRPVYGSEILEEAQAIYVSNIFDGGRDFRFWREISWSPLPENQPTGTSVLFEVRTGSSESDLLSRSWNNIGSENNPNILDPFDTPNQELIDFSQNSVNINNEIVFNRFIQFRMTLKSTVKNVTPTVNDVTIVYSKQNSVNFFTTTFNLTSNIVRSILTYNGDIPTSPSGVALSDIQFGICTEEESDGKVTTNFDRYTIIPTNEAFSLSSLGVRENSKFRIGIRFVSTEGSIPTVDEFAMLWETSDGKRDKVKDLIDRTNNS